MNRKLALYVASISVLAFTCASVLRMQSPGIDHASLVAIALLSILAMVAELLAFVLPNSARGSIAFIPYLAAAVVVPSWTAIVAIVVVRAIVETVRRVNAQVAVFNVAQHALTLCVAILVFRGFGGTSLLAMPESSFVRATAVVGFPAIAAFVASFFSNGLITCGYLALQKQKRLSQLWRQMVLPTVVAVCGAWRHCGRGALGSAVGSTRSSPRES
jgi:hypothetical protein